MTIGKRPLSPHLGLEITGVDLSQPIDGPTERAIREAWLEAGVLLFRGKTNEEQHLRLSRLFGELEEGATVGLNSDENPYLMKLEHNPEAIDERFAQQWEIDGMARVGFIGWHWDQSFMPTIVRGACLRMIKPARVLGQTGFLDAIAAYDRLSDELKARIEGLEVVYKFTLRMDENKFGMPRMRELPREVRPGAPKAKMDYPETVHPLVITQQETGRKVLKLSPIHAKYVLGMDRAESDALLTELAKVLTDMRYSYFHDWQADDMIVWDNWRVCHATQGVPIDVPRLGMRTTIAGDYKVGRYLDPALDRNREVVRFMD